MPTLIHDISHPDEAEAIEPGTPIAEPDADLVEALRDGRSDAAETLVTRFGSRVYRLAARITDNAQDAEEVTQDALWQVVRKIATFRGQAAFRSWVYRIAANAAYEMLRRRRRTRSEVSWEELAPRFNAQGEHAAPVNDWSAHVEDPAVQGELRAALSRAISLLPAELRIIVVMRDVDGMSNTEVAVTLAMTVPAVKSRLHRARLMLREYLSRSWVDQQADHRDCRQRGCSRLSRARSRGPR